MSPTFYSRIALVFFLVFYAAVIYWVFRPGQKKRLDGMARNLIFDAEQGETNEQ